MSFLVGAVSYILHTHRMCPRTSRFQAEYLRLKVQLPKYWGVGPQIPLLRLKYLGPEAMITLWDPPLSFSM